MLQQNLELEGKELEVDPINLSDDKIREEFIKYFKSFDIDINPYNDWLWFTIKNPEKLLRGFGWDQNVSEETFKKISAGITLATANSWDPIKTNLIINIDDSSDPDTSLLMHSNIYDIQRWFNKKNNYFNSLINIQKRHSQSFKETKTFRPTFIINAFRIEFNEPDHLVSMAPVKENTRSIIFKFDGNFLEFIYIWDPNWEKCEVTINDIKVLETYIPDQNIVITKETITNIVHDSKKELEKILKK